MTVLRVSICSTNYTEAISRKEDLLSRTLMNVKNFINRNLAKVDSISS
jgi:hypothetical protein